VTWRIGSVPYLNARPLIYGIEERVTLCSPARLADLMRRRQIDVGLAPVAEVLARDQYAVLDGFAIASQGAVRSVFLAHREPVGKLRRVAVDTASRTSAWLVRVILKHAHGVEPEFYPRPAGAKLSEHEAMMLIGDEAIWYLMRAPERCAGVLDLGEAWRELTGLPFVYAVWAVHQAAAADPAALGELARLLREAKTAGLAHIEEIVADATEGTPEFRREYLTQNVTFDLGDAEKRGLARFQQYAREMGLTDSDHAIRYIG
jgi:chorismate dehydratase